MNGRERCEPTARRRSVGYAVRVGRRKLHVGIGYYPDGSPCEVRVSATSARVGSSLWVALEVWSDTASLALQYGAPLRELASGQVGVEDGTGGKLDADPDLHLPPRALSVWDAIGQVLLVANEP